MGDAWSALLALRCAPRSALAMRVRRRSAAKPERQASKPQQAKLCGTTSCAAGGSGGASTSAWCIDPANHALPSLEVMPHSWDWRRRRHFARASLRSALGCAWLDMDALRCGFDAPCRRRSAAKPERLAFQSQQARLCGTTSCEAGGSGSASTSARRINPANHALPSLKVMPHS